MKNSQLTKILRTFSRQELKSFEKFVRSPYFNTSEATTKLYDEVKIFYPGFAGAGFTKEKLFAKIYGKRKYSRELINKLISNLIKLSMEFFIVSGNTLKQYFLLRNLRKKRLDNHFRSVYKKISAELECENLNEGDVLYQIMINLENGNFNLDTDNYYAFQLANMRNMELVTVYFLERLAANHIEKTNLSITPEIEKRRVVLMLNENINYESLHEQAGGSELFYKDRIRHMLSLILLHKNREERFYREIKASVFDTPLEDADVINLAYIYLLDYITYRIKSGDESYFSERHLVYKKIEHDSFATGNVKIIFTFFRNFILSGINTGDFEWSKYVLNKYIGDVEGKGNIGVRFYFEALISFHEGDFEGALVSINKLDLKNIAIDKFSLYFDMRFLKFKIFFELDYIEESLSMIDSFEHYLKKDKGINKAVKPSYDGFVKYFKKLIKYKLKDDRMALEEITAKMTSEKIHEKKWLLKKAAEIIAR